MSAALPGTVRSRAPVKLAALLGAVALVVAVGCAPATEPANVAIVQTGVLQVNVVDSVFDAGRSPSVRLGADGQPSVAYLLYQPVLKTGEIPPAIKPGDPQPPSVVMATLAKGIWTRSAIPAQPPAGTAGGLAPEIANQDGQAIDGVATSLAVDSQGKHHVVWSTPTGLFYSNDTSGSFSAPDKVAQGATFGASVAVGTGGTVWISYYGGGSLQVASGQPGSWSIDTAAVNAGPASEPATVSAIAVNSSGNPVVAFADQGKTGVLQSSGAVWRNDTVPGDGGYGVSLALDTDGNPHVAYYDRNGGIHVATSLRGGPFQAADIGTTTGAQQGQPDARWSTGIAVDDAGTTYVTWADTKASRIDVGSGQGGQFTTQEVQNSAGGANPSLAVSADGKTAALAWFDATNTNLNVGESSTGVLVLAHPLPTNQQPSVSPTPSPTGTELPCEPDGTDLQVAAVNLTFDKTCLAAPEGQDFTLEFDNQEAVPHNVEIFPSAADAAALSNRLGGAEGPSDIITGPGSVTYQVPALEAGVYYFQCDIHPQQMNGTFVVAKA
jgi:plastocyanin